MGMFDYLQCEVVLPGETAVAAFLVLRSALQAGAG